MQVRIQDPLSVFTRLISFACSAHILPLAEKLIILSPDGQIVEQKPPGGLTVDCTDVLGAACKDDPSNVSETKQIVQGVNKSNEEQKQDLSRQTGDLAVYTYYLRYIGWPLSMLFVGSVVCNTFTSLFPRESSLSISTFYNEISDIVI